MRQIDEVLQVFDGGESSKQVKNVTYAACDECGEVMTLDELCAKCYAGS